ncbi:unnamed protein product [Adineta ricciae]|uniref:Uncharacterized protein n=1 Tax=Adineta ricciae TaxID=249248 RepID=A0A814Z1A8_ADIRI|nr:unnamed protein product [Adineta ricciae]CAF1236480.1 unnamed protein product [Adineta ricciae]
MQIANRTTRRYITPPANNRLASKKPAHVPPVSHSSPKKAVDTSAPKTKDDPATLKKLVDRFRYDEPQARPERESINSDFWWLHDELKNTYGSNTDRDDGSQANIPEFIEVFPSTDIDHDLSKRASLLLNQTMSAHSSDVGHVSSVGIGSTPSTTMTTTTTTSTFQPPIREQPARPLFTRITDSKYDFKSDGGDEDILYQWRLRRRLEQAQNGEPITFSSKIANRANLSPVRSILPCVPIEIPTVVLPLPTPPPPPISSVTKPLSPQPIETQQQQPLITISDSEPVKQHVTTPIPIRHYSEAATQTLQDACIQTSPTIEHSLSSSNFMTNEIDLCPTRDENHQSSVWHRPPPSLPSKCELTRTPSSPSPVKRHHHRHHHHHSFRPVVSAGHPTIQDSSHHQQSMIYPSNTVQSSQDSTLTQVTSIMLNDNHHHHPINLDNHEPYRDNTSITIIDESQQDYGHVDYSNDEILNILIQKRNELLVTFRDIEQQLACMN